MQIRVIGNVEPLSTVQIKSQVTGQIQSIYFDEGQFVKKGAPLLLIDPRPYDAQVKQSEANLAKDLAQVKQAQATVEKDKAQLNQAEATLRRDLAQQKFSNTETGRYDLLVKEGAVSKEQSDQVSTNEQAQNALVESDMASIRNVKALVDVDKSAVDNARAVADADRAALGNARVQLGYCHIFSPIDGVAGSYVNHLGDMIKANDTNAIVVLNEVSPIYVSFSVPEAELTQIRKLRAQNILKVIALPTGSTTPLQGNLTFFDNTVDSATGTIRLKATFPNKDHELWPGQFAQVSLNLSTSRNAVCIPAQAVQVAQKGQYVFVVKPDGTADMRAVITSRNYEGDAVIESGVKSGETVVTDGHLQVVPGKPVRVVNRISGT